MQRVEVLRKQGYDARTIAVKTGINLDYVQGVLNLMEKGDDRLLTPVEGRYMPITLAINIANSPGEEQQALQDAYEAKELRGNKFLLAKRLLSTRRRQGKWFLNGNGRKRDKSGDKPFTAQSVLKVYKKEVDRKRLLARKANRTSQSLLFVKEALRDLLEDDGFKKLLQSEDLLTFPKPLADLLTDGGCVHG